MVLCVHPVNFLAGDEKNPPTGEDQQILRSSIMEGIDKELGNAYIFIIAQTLSKCSFLVSFQQINQLF